MITIKLNFAMIFSLLYMISTSCFGMYSWEEIAILNDNQLVNQGISHKHIKDFERHKEIELRNQEQQQYRTTTGCLTRCADALENALHPFNFEDTAIGDDRGRCYAIALLPLPLCLSCWMLFPAALTSDPTVCECMGFAAIGCQTSLAAGVLAARAVAKGYAFDCMRNCRRKYDVKERSEQPSDRIVRYRAYLSLLQQQQCTICLDSLQGEHACQILKCGHAFHKNCINKWLELSQGRCSVCKKTT